jgi:hypothetical protein
LVVKQFLGAEKGTGLSQYSRGLGGGPF